MKLRPYQQAAIDAAVNALNAGMQRPLVCLPTGSGKSPVICELANRALKKGHRVLVTVHTQELISQLAATYEGMYGQAPSVFSASLRSKDIGDITVAQVQSAARCPGSFGRIGLVIVDECDRVPADGDGQYRTLVTGLEVANPSVRVCGFTATPYRMSSGLVFGPEQFFTDLVYDAKIIDLINDGYLAPIRSKHGETPDLSKLHVRNGEYVAAEVEEAFAVPEKVKKAVAEIVYYGQDRKAWLVFASGVEHGKMVQAELLAHGIDAPFVTGETPDLQRKEWVEQYKAKQIRCMISINVLSVGFDAPHVDMIVLLRPTLSPGLYYQQVGRGLRISPGKTDCLILDMAGNIEEHGPIDTLNDRMERKARVKTAGEAPVKICPKCKELILAGMRTCPACGYEFPRDPAKHDTTATTEAILSCVETHKVGRVFYTIHDKRPGHAPTLRVSYYAEMLSMEPIATEFVSLEKRRANPAAYQIALKWLRQIPLREHEGRMLTVEHGITGSYKGISEPIETILRLLPYIKCLTPPATITIYHNGKHPQVIGRSWENRC